MKNIDVRSIKPKTNFTGLLLLSISFNYSIEIGGSIAKRWDPSIMGECGMIVQCCDGGVERILWKYSLGYVYAYLFQFLCQ